MKRIFLFCSPFIPIYLLAQQHLDIYALRVEFQEDNNNLTTGNGHFVSEDNIDLMLQDINIDSFTIDPPPHDRRYFQDQIIYFVADPDYLQFFLFVIF